VVTADAGLQRPPTRRFAGHIALGFVALLLFFALHLTTGRLEEGNGEGWDGTDYARMLRLGWASGTIITQYRPLIVWANGPAYAVTGNAVQAFDAMNYVYVFAVALLLSMLLDRYGAPFSVRAVAIVCICLSIPFRLFAFYPVLIDLGACAVITVAIWLILSGRRWAVAAACVAAALAREFGPAVILFGVHRDLRKGVRLWTIAATYLPGTLAYIALRAIVTSIWAGREDGITADFLYNNLRLWRDPMFGGLFAYFVLTISGGISLVIAAQPGRCWRLIKEEPEWLSFAVPILVASALVGMDTIRYITALLPAVAVLFARCSREWSSRERWAFLAVALALTVWTQQPFQPMNTSRYFADWFPYYVWAREYPRPDPPSLWPEWGWRFIVVAGSLCALLAFRSDRGRRVVAD
jgi:hypothetical protein